MRTVLQSTLLLLALAGCSPTLPPRYVVEQDVGGYSYRRYQHVLDVEMPVAGNAAEGHTATYFRRGDEGVFLATAFVTVYEKARGLSAEVRDRVEDLTTVDAVVQEREGENVWILEGDAPWVLWVSGKHLVKLGGPVGGAVPEDILERYLDLYPSDLDEHGAAEEGAASAGPSAAEIEESEELDVPHSLQEGAAR